MIIRKHNRYRYQYQDTGITTKPVKWQVASMNTTDQKLRIAGTGTSDTALPDNTGYHKCLQDRVGLFGVRGWLFEREQLFEQPNRLF